jgi:hypothetical protein
MYPFLLNEYLKNENKDFFAFYSFYEFLTQFSKILLKTSTLSGTKILS